MIKALGEPHIIMLVILQRIIYISYEKFTLAGVREKRFYQ